MDASVARKGYSVVLQRTLRELRGTACLDLEVHAANKQQISCSRSFGAPVYSVNELAEAFAE
jgi:DNA polymerase V